MKKKLMPQTVAPVQRETSATVSRREGNAIAPSESGVHLYPFAAGDDAE